MDFIRGFRAAGNQLKKESKMTSRELVKEFLATLEISYREAITVRLGSTKQIKDALDAQRLRLDNLESNGPNAANVPNAAAPAKVARYKRQTIEYEIEDVLDEAKAIATEVQNNGGTYSPRSSLSRFREKPIKEETDSGSVEEVLAALKDQMVLAEKRENARKDEMKTWASQMIKSNQDMMARLTGSLEQSRIQLLKRDEQPYVPKVAPAQPSFNGMIPKGNCFYCGEVGHMQDDCEHRKKHIRLGWIVIENGRFRLPEGHKLPYVPGNGPRIPKIRIEEYWSSLDKRQAESNVLEIYEFMQDSEPELATTQSFNYGVLAGKEPVQPNPKPDLASLITQAGITWEDLQSLVQTRRNNYGQEGSSGDNQNF